MEKLLTSFGLGKKEQKIWLKLLELGSQSILELSRHCTGSRTALYVLLEKMADLGLVESIGQTGKKQYRCVRVSILVDRLREKTAEIKKAENLLEMYLPELQRLENQSRITPKFQSFEGAEAVAQMYEQALENRGEWWAVFDPKMVVKYLPQFADEIPRTLARNRIKAFEILASNPQSQKYQKTFSTPTHQIKILPSEYETPSDIIISGDQLYLTAYGEKTLSAAAIWSPSLAHSQRSILKALWESI